MIIGIGIDLIEVDRVERLMERHPERSRDRLFTESEVKHCRASRRAAESFAARFAAKEALFKALGTGWGGGAAWRDVEVVVDDRGAPRILLHGETQRMAERRGLRRVHLTLTHTDGVAGAFVVLEGVNGAG